MSVPLGGEAPVSDRLQIFVGGIEDFVQSAAIAIVPALNEYSELISVGQGWGAYYHPRTGRSRTLIGSCLHPYSTTLLQRHQFPLPPGLNHSMSVQKMQCSTSRPTIASTTLGLSGDGSPSQEGLFQSVASRPYQPWELGSCCTLLSSQVLYCTWGPANWLGPVTSRASMLPT